jgi:ATP-dependent DNA ligase
MLDRVLAEGGEGLIYRRPFELYQCARTRNMLKHKPLQDAEALVVGYYWGKEPDMRKSLTGTAVGTRMGVMGGVLVEMNGKRFILSGTGFPFKDCQMVFKETGTCAADVGIENPGKPVSDDIYNPLYPLGSILTFTYRSYTNDGIPVEARFKRRRM